jgi:hypothetical protein
MSLTRLGQRARTRKGFASWEPAVRWGSQEKCSGSVRNRDDRAPPVGRGVGDAGGQRDARGRRRRRDEGGGAERERRERRERGGERHHVGESARGVLREAPRENRHERLGHVRSRRSYGGGHAPHDSVDERRVPPLRKGVRRSRARRGPRRAPGCPRACLPRPRLLSDRGPGRLRRPPRREHAARRGPGRGCRDRGRGGARAPR